MKSSSVYRILGWLFIGCSLILMVYFLSPQGSNNQIKISDLPIKNTPNVIPPNLNLTFTHAERVYIPELQFLLETLKIAVAKDWSGPESSDWPVSLHDYHPGFLTTLFVQEKQRNEGIIIPQVLRSLYTTDTASLEMISLIKTIKQEYLNYAKDKGVSPKYLEEIETVTLPDEQNRIFYYANIHYPDTNNTNVHTLEQVVPIDYSQLQMDVYASNIYKIAREFDRSGILGQGATIETDDFSRHKLLRDMAARYVVYHEMTHVLQTAVDVVNAPQKEKKVMIPWRYSSRNVLQIDPTYYQTWGSGSDLLTRNINNLTIAKESQAEGVSIQMLAEIYRFSNIQQQLVIEYHFGPLEEGKRSIEEIFKLMELNYSESSLEYLTHSLQADVIEKISGEERQLLLKIHSRLDGFMASHYGYLHPMMPDKIYHFWDYIRE